MDTIENLALEAVSMNIKGVCTVKANIIDKKKPYFAEFAFGDGKKSVFGF